MTPVRYRAKQPVHSCMQCNNNATTSAQLHAVQQQCNNQCTAACSATTMQQPVHSCMQCNNNATTSAQLHAVQQQCNNQCTAACSATTMQQPVHSCMQCNNNCSFQKELVTQLYMLSALTIHYTTAHAQYSLYLVTVSCPRSQKVTLACSMF